MTRKNKYGYGTTESIIDSEHEYDEEIDEFPVQEQNGPETRYGIVINTQYVNLRKEPSYTAEVLDILAKGDRVKILEHLKERGFYRISVRNLSATKDLDDVYISSKFLKEE